MMRYDGILNWSQLNAPLTNQLLEVSFSLTSISKRNSKRISFVGQGSLRKVLQPLTDPYPSQERRPSLCHGRWMGRVKPSIFGRNHGGLCEAHDAAWRRGFYQKRSTNGGFNGDLSINKMIYYIVKHHHFHWAGESKNRSPKRWTRKMLVMM